MKVAYYPGCSLEGTARDYADSIKSVCRALDIELEEVPDWNCCGATAAHSINHKASIELAARNLRLAASLGLENMVVPCPLCFNRLKTAEWELVNEGREGYDILLPKTLPVIWDLANFLATPEILERVSEGTKKPLKGLKVVCYYGCMANRPPHVTGEKDFENPKSMDRIVEALGATAIDWPYKTDCCGASLMISRPEIGYRLVGKLFSMAKQLEAQLVVVSCQMCHANLDLYQEKVNEAWGEEVTLPVVYFTEMIALAWGLKGVKSWLSRHFSNALLALQELGFLE